MVQISRRDMRACLLFGALLIVFSASAQTSPQAAHKLDSSYRSIAAMPDDSLKSEAYDALVTYCVLHGLPEPGVRYANEWLALTQRLRMPEAQMKAYGTLGNLYQALYDYSGALQAMRRGLHIAEEQKNQIGRAIFYNNIANVFIDQRKYADAVPYSQKFMEIARSLQDSTAMWLALNSLGNTFSGQGDHEKARGYFESGLRLAEARGDSSEVATMANNLGAAYEHLGKPLQALQLYNRALPLARQEGNNELTAAILSGIGAVHLSFAKNGLPAAPGNLIPASRSAALAKGISALDEAVSISKKAKDYGKLSSAAEDLADAYALSGNYAAALDAHKTFSDAKDTVLNQQNSTALRNFEVSRAVDVKDKELRIAQLELARKRNARYALLAGIIVLLGVSLMLFRNLRRQHLLNKKLAQEKQRSEDLLLNILPAEVASELKENGSATARLYEDVTVLFTDFVNFTTVSGQLGPQALVGELNECFSAFDTIIARHGLEKIKTVGDAYIAVCGLPVADPQHAQKCVLAALEIRDFMDARNQSGHLTEVRIGVNSGPVVAGIVGLKKFAYDIWGDTVNTAARMEQHGAPGQVNISQSTYLLVREAFHCSPRGRVAAKNMGEVDMYFAEAPVSELSTIA
jgi:class 3 adenylate cyclase